MNYIPTTETVRAKAERPGSMFARDEVRAVLDALAEAESLIATLTAERDEARIACNECGQDAPWHEEDCKYLVAKDRAEAAEAQAVVYRQALERIAGIKPDTRPINEDDNYYRAAKAVAVAQSALAAAVGGPTPNAGEEFKSA